MAVERVHCVGELDLSDDAVWSRLRGFADPWHPMVDWMELEPGDGRIVRRFGVAGDDTVMREELTWFSDSDRSYAYRALDGIEGAARYEACLSVQAGRVTWTAETEAAPDRAKEIAEGTRAVFEAGLAEIAGFEGKIAPRTGAQRVEVDIEERKIGESPRLGLSVSPAGTGKADTILLFLHGIGGNRGNWRRQLAALGAYVPAVALDLRGYGDSSLGADPSGIADYAGDIRAVMAEFKAQRVILCGLSYGAWIAASFALENPDLVAGLILCGGCTGMSEADEAEREAFLTSRRVPLDAGKTPADFADAVVDAIAGPHADDSVLVELCTSMAAIPDRTYRDALNCFCNPLGRLDFERSNFPVLMMTGEHDRLAPPKEIRAVSQRFHASGAPYTRFEVIGGAGHVCNVEAPETVNTMIAEFLTGLLAKTLRPMGKDAKRREKRRRILDAALAEFSRSGYSGASMQAIAAGAGVSKPTLYQYIGQKDALFRAVLERGRAEILAPFEAAEGRDMVEVLWRFSWAYADFVLRPDNLSVARLVIGEAERVPEIARQFQETGPAQAQAGIAAYLVSRRDAGELRFDDADLASDHLWSLILSGPRSHALHFPDDLPGPGDLRKSIVAGLRVFLRAYASDPDTALATLERILQTDAT